MKTMHTTALKLAIFLGTLTVLGLVSWGTALVLNSFGITGERLFALVAIVMTITFVVYSYRYGKRMFASRSDRKDKKENHISN